MQKRLILTVHGIRTYGNWQSRLEKIIRNSVCDVSDDTLDFRHYRYGFFTIFSFIIPFLRQVAVWRFRSHLFNLLRERSYDRIDIVAHSFGTFLLAKTLISQKLPGCAQIHTVILCGSVLSPDFNVSRLVGADRPVRRLVNECGLKDNVLLLTLFVVGVGMAGRLGLHGFEGTSLRNRYFWLGHSGYFEGKTPTNNDEFMQRWWSPLFLEDDEIVAYDERPESPPAIDRFWRALGENGSGFTFSFYAFVLTLVLGSISYLWFQAAKERDRANFLLDQTLESTSNLIRQVASNYGNRIDVSQEFVLRLVRDASGMIDRVLVKEEGNSSILLSSGLTLLQLSRSLENRGLYDEALDVASRSLIAFRDADAERSTAGVRHAVIAGLNQIGDIWLRKGNAEQGFEAFVNAKKLIEQMENGTKKREFEARVSIKLGQAAIVEQDGERARSFFMEADNYFLEYQDIESIRELSLIKDGIGQSYIMEHNHNKAAIYFEESLEYAKSALQMAPEQIDTIHDVASAYDRVGTAYYSLKKWEKAAKNFRENIEFAEMLFESDQSSQLWIEKKRISHRKYADTLARMYNYYEAIAHLEASIVLSDKIVTANPSSVDAIRALGEAHLSKYLFALKAEEYGKALEFAKVMLKKFSTLESEEVIVDNYIGASLNNISWSALIDGRFSESLSAAKSALAVSPHIVAAKLNKAHALMFLGEFDDARRSYEEILNDDNNDDMTRRKLGEMLHSDARTFLAVGLSRDVVSAIQSISRGHNTSDSE